MALLQLDASGPHPHSVAPEATPAKPAEPLGLDLMRLDAVLAEIKDQFAQIGAIIDRLENLALRLAVRP